MSLMTGPWMSQAVTSTVLVTQERTLQEAGITGGPLGAWLSHLSCIGLNDNVGKALIPGTGKNSLTPVTPVPSTVPGTD